jgi:AcrR family transcriptional regulator
MSDVTTAAPRTGRAAPLPPDERRRAILRAVRPTLLDRGVEVTTKELADAAGVAEGTLFRVFEDKNTLLREAATSALDPAEMLAELEAVDPELDLAERIDRAVRIGMHQSERIILWMSVLHRLTRPDSASGSSDRASHGGPGGHGPWKARQSELADRVSVALRRLLEPDAHRLRIGLDEATTILEVMLVGATMHRFDRARRGDPADAVGAAVIADVFLTGVLGAGPPGDEASPHPHPCTTKDDPTC